MSHIHIESFIHIVFSTKDRLKTISRDTKESLWSEAADICKRKKIFVHAIGGMEDHIHLLLNIPPTMSVEGAVLTIQADSAKWMRRQVSNFAWQEGYGAFSVSRSDIPSVKKYIQNQEKLHSKMTYEEEFILLLEMNRVEYDPKSVFG